MQVTQKLFSFNIVDEQTIYLPGYTGSDFSNGMTIYLYFPATNGLMQVVNVIINMIQSPEGSTFTLNNVLTIAGHGYIILLSIIPPSLIPFPQAAYVPTYPIILNPNLTIPELSNAKNFINQFGYQDGTTFQFGITGWLDTFNITATTGTFPTYTTSSLFPSNIAFNFIIANATEPTVQELLNIINSTTSYLNVICAAIIQSQQAVMINNYEIQSLKMALINSGLMIPPPISITLSDPGGGLIGNEASFNVTLSAPFFQDIIINPISSINTDSCYICTIPAGTLQENMYIIPNGISGIRYISITSIPPLIYIGSPASYNAT